MNVVGAIEKTAISGFVDLIGHGDLFSRVVVEIERNNAAMPSATGAEKRAKVLADCKIIFDDIAVPVGEKVLRMLLELGVAYIEAAV